MIDNGTGLFTIGQLARGSGLSVRTIRKRVMSAAHAEPARFRELAALVRGVEPLGAHTEEFAWVVAALRPRAAG